MCQTPIPIIPHRTTYRTSPHPSCRRSRCRSRTASGPGRSGCSCSGTDKARMFSRLDASKKTKEKKKLSAEFTGLNTFKKNKRQADRKIMPTALLLGLIRAIATVVLAVTLPACRDAATRVLTAELVHTTRHLSCTGRGEEKQGLITAPITTLAIFIKPRYPDNLGFFVSYQIKSCYLYQRE